MRTPVSLRRDLERTDQRRKQVVRLFAAGKNTLVAIIRELRVVSRTSPVSAGPNLWPAFPVAAVSSPSRRAPRRSAISTCWSCFEFRFGLRPARARRAGQRCRYLAHLGRRKKLANEKLGSFSGESGVFQRPSVGRTWAPRGETRVIRAFNWSKMSVCAAIGYRWGGRRSRLLFRTREGSDNPESPIRFRANLHRDLGGQTVILGRDGLPAHQCRAIKE
jgi:hypothetical protein